MLKNREKPSPERTGVAKMQHSHFHCRYAPWLPTHFFLFGIRNAFKPSFLIGEGIYIPKAKVSKKVVAPQCFFISKA